MSNKKKRNEHDSICDVFSTFTADQSIQYEADVLVTKKEGTRWCCSY